jgi:hypothetical protein
MDWQTSGPIMSTIEQVIVDGANGVTQAPRLTQFVPAWQWLLAIAFVALGIVAQRRVNLRRWALAAAVVAVMPGYLQVFVMRADAPTHQKNLVKVVTRAQAAYLAHASVALAKMPDQACYEPVRDASCIPWGGLHDAMADRLGPARRCFLGSGRPVVRLSVRECSDGDVIVELLP